MPRISGGLSLEDVRALVFAG